MNTQIYKDKPRMDPKPSTTSSSSSRLSMCAARSEAGLLRDSSGLRSEVQGNDFGSIYDCHTCFWEFLKPDTQVYLRILTVMKTPIFFAVPFMLVLASSAVGMAASRELLADPIFTIDPWDLGIKYDLLNSIE